MTRNELHQTHKVGSQWENCYIFHNGDLLLDACWESLVICDGNVSFHRSRDARNSLIIARGSITSPETVRYQGSVLYAGGDISAKKSWPWNGLLLARGKVDVPSGQTDVSKIHISKLKENPFPVRFFETADAGVECEFKNDTLTITKLTPGSALTNYGLKEGDVVRRLNDKVIESANDFRRELRYAIVLEAGIFHITRDKEKLTRVVYFKNGIEK